MAFMMNSSKPFKEEIMLIMHKKGGTLFNSFYEASITLIPKAGLNIGVEQKKKKTEKSKYRLIPFV